MNYTTIAAKLKELLDEISDFSVVYDYDPDAISGYPAATLQAQGHQDRFHDTAANVRAFTFLIRVYYRMDVDADAETILRDLTDQVIVKLEQNVTVQDVWDIAMPTQAIFTVGQREMPVRVAEITVSIECRVLR